MCRIFYSPSETLTFAERDFWSYLETLEKIGGKDGNGIYTFSNDLLERDHKLMPTWVEINNGPVLFHTRIATRGKVAKYNVQPFVGERYILVHNGTFGYQIDNVALLFGLYQGKYSDSWQIHKIIEEVGVMNFYLAYKDKSFGVLLIYDKIKKVMWLLKTCGEFERGILSGQYIYASCRLDFWNNMKKIEDFDNGLYILRSDGYRQLDKITTRTYHGGYYQRGAYNKQTNSWTQESINKKKQAIFKQRKKAIKELRKRRLALEGITESIKELPDKTDEDIAGIESLFPPDTKEPTECDICNKKITRYYWHIDNKRNMCSECFNEMDATGGLYNTARLLAVELKQPKECFECGYATEDACMFHNKEDKNFVGTVDESINLKRCHTSYRLVKNMTKMCEYCGHKLEDVYFIDKNDNLVCGICESEKTTEKMDEIYICTSCGTTQDTTIRYVDTHENELCGDCFKTSMIEKMPKKCEWCGLHFVEGDEVYINDVAENLCEECNQYNVYDNPYESFTYIKIPPKDDYHS